MRYFPHESSQRLRDLAAWYREYAERAGNSSIWDARLRTAEDLEKEADLLDQQRERAASPRQGKQTRAAGKGDSIRAARKQRECADDSASSGGGCGPASVTRRYR